MGQTVVRLSEARRVVKSGKAFTFSLKDVQWSRLHEIVHLRRCPRLFNANYP